MKNLLYITILFCASCSTTVEKMDKGTPTGDHYVFINSQWGSKMTIKTSMGTALAVDSVDAAIAAIQAVVSVKGLDMQTKIALAKEVTSRYKAGQITLQMRDKLNAAIMGAETEAGLKIALAQIAAGT